MLLGKLDHSIKRMNLDAYPSYCTNSTPKDQEYWHNTWWYKTAREKIGLCFKI